MADNPFSLAVKSGLGKQYSVKEYLMKVEGMTEQQAQEKMDASIEPEPAPPAP